MKGYHLIIVLIVFIFSGCGNEVSTSTKDGSTTITMAILDGTWIGECQFISSSSTSAKRTYTFSTGEACSNGTNAQAGCERANNQYNLFKNKVNKQCV